MEFDAELSNLPQEEERLQNARTSLVRFRNSVPTFVKIHQLSHEILSQIFLEAHREWITSRDKLVFPTLPTGLSSVCHSWRSVALALPTLWSCVDIAVDAPNSDAYYECAQLWAARSNAALSVHIWHSSEADTTQVSEPGASGLISFLAPTASRIRHLKLDCYLVSDVPQYAMACMVNFGAPGFLSTLDLEVEECDTDPLEFLPLVAPGQLEDPPDHMIDDFLRPVTKLTLTSVIIPWTSAVYSNLVELVICFTYYGPDQAPQKRKDLAGVLRSSPQLRAVSLTDHEFWDHNDDDDDNGDDDEWTAEASPIHLKDLRSLTLSSAGGDGSASLLPLFAPGPHPLYFKIWLEAGPRFDAEFELFLSRSNVTALCVENEEGPWFTSLRHSLSRLESLTLQKCNFSDTDLFVFSVDQRDGFASPPWPRLNSLHLVDCRIKENLLEHLLAIHPIKQLRINYTHSYYRLERAEEDQMMEGLKKLVPDTVLSAPVEPTTYTRG
ncbi:hypothetical protein FS749_003203 [Ceratobasidium sp. UAMH 11750]|nr:hypothetical protein FS749_003203 [Ceratobasidium sp. UAMH 11750]